MEDEDEKYIAITHFSNPHQFYFTCTEDNSYIEVQELEEQLNKLYLNNYSLTTRNFIPVEGSLVAVHYTPNRKGFIRARVEQKLTKQYTKTASYIVWAIDHGFPFETEEKYLRYLPEELSKHIERVRCGGIAKIVPAEEDFDFINQQTVLEVKNKWSTYACDALEKKLMDAASIAFSEKFKTKNGHCWGDLHVVNHQGLLFRVSDYLINKKLALRNVEKFKEFCIKSNCTQIPVWHSSRGNAKYGKNKYSTVESGPYFDERACLLNKNELQSAKMKVAAWTTHNENASYYTGHGSTRQASSVVSSNIYDTDLEDSVSKVGYAEDDLKSVTLTNRGIHKKFNKPPPPKPTLADFGILEETLNSEVAEDCVSLDNITSVSRQQQVEKVPPANKRQAYLLDLRKKQMSKQKAESGDNTSTQDLDCSSTVADNPVNVFVIKSTACDITSSCSENLRKLELSPEKTEYNENSTKESNHNGPPLNRKQYLNALRLKGAKSKESDENDASSIATSANPKPVKHKSRMQPGIQNMIPAGFDLTNLNTYNDKNHWHRKNTTRNSNQPLNISYSSDSSNQNQDFRFTRQNTEKYKTCKDDKLKKKEIKALNTKVSPDKNLILPTQPVKMKPTCVPNKNECLLVKPEIPLPTLMQQTHSKTASDMDSPFFGNPKYSEFNLNHSKNTFLSDSSEDSDQSRYSSAHSNIDEDSQEENNLQKTPHVALKPIKRKIISPPKIENMISDKHEISKNRSSILNHSSQRERDVITISHDDENIMRTKFVEHLVLAHSEIQLYTSEKLENIFLATTVTEEMKRMFIDKVYRLQSYAWSHMIGGNGLFIVNAPNSGKTWSYLPPLCSSITFAIQNSIFPCTYGPMAIILVPSADHAIEIGNLCTRLLSKLDASDAKTIVSYGLQTLTNTKIQLMEACAILVTTPLNLLRLMQEDDRKARLFDPHRIQHIVIDDIDVMLSHMQNDFIAVFKKLYSLVPKVPKTKKIQPQLVVTSCLYRLEFNKLIPISNQPLLLIADFLEAAVYGKANITIKLCPKEEKMMLIMQFIRKHSILHERLIILCNSESDVLHIVENLITNGISTIAFHRKSPISARAQIEEWKAQPNPMKVLVCSDDVFPELEIQNAQNLIHYSLAKTWTKFTSRFISLIRTYQNLVVKGFDGPPPEKRATSLILLDEDNNSELPRLIEFLKNHNHIDRVHPDVLELSKSIQIQRETKRRSDCTQLCSSLFEFGECNNSRCEYRHVLAIADVEQNNNEMLQYGDVRLLVLNVFSPTHFSARILEHRATPSSKWSVVRKSKNAAAFATKFNYYYFDINNLKMHWPIRANDLCVCKKNDRYYRARVLDASKIKSINIIQSVLIKLKLIDTGDIIYVKSDEVYVCPDRFRDFPAQAVDIRLIGIVPFDNERIWDSIATKHVEVLIKDSLKKNECVHASIDFALNDAFWVNNVVIMEQLPTVKNNAYIVNLKRHLVSKKYGIMDKNVITKIHNVIQEQGFGHILDKTEVVNSADTSIQSEIKQDQVTETTLEIKQKPINSELNVNNNHVSISPNKESSVDSSAISANEISKTDSTVKSATPLITFEDFFMCMQRSMQLDEEEFNEDEKKAKDTKEYKLETEEPKTINEFIYNENNIIQRKIMEKTTKPAIKTKDYVNITETKESQLKQRMTSMPSFFDLHPRPNTIWYETNYLIILSIHAPDIDDYYLEVSQSSLYFTACVNSVRQVLVLNFLGTVEPDLVSHEIRGLVVVVRLVKSLYMKWPRLLKQKEKPPWLKYNINMINTKELMGNVLHTNLSRPVNYNYDEPVDSDDNEYDFETFTPIVNKEDFHDPIGSELI